MQTVYLNGGIAQFGEKWNTNCANIRDIFKLIECQTPGFRRYILNAADNGVGFEIQRGSEFLEEPEELLLSLRDEDIIITEVPAGAKSGGAKILAAIAIALVAAPLGAAIAGAGATTGTAASIGALGGTASTFQVAGSFAKIGAFITKAGYAIATNLALQGISQLLAPGPETEEQRESYLFDGPVNNIEQGLPVPVLYGELIVGGAPVSVYYQSNKFRFTQDGSVIKIQAGDVTVQGLDNSGIGIGIDGLTDEDLYGEPLEVQQS